MNLPKHLQQQAVSQQRLSRRPHRSWQEYFKTLVNGAAGLFGARIVGAHWGPRGVREALMRVKQHGFRPGLIFDIGASNGQWTRECLPVFDQSRYVLVDPLEDNRDALAHLASTDDRICVFHGVVSDKTGLTQIHNHGDQSSVLLSEDFPGFLTSVEATTVDTLFDAQDNRSPVLLKADVQGYELEVLKGASRCLASTEMLILEVSFRRIYKDCALAHEVIAYVGERGFRVYEICSYLQRVGDRDLIQSDFVFVHESSALFARHGWT